VEAAEQRQDLTEEASIYQSINLKITYHWQLEW
jgi:hypothetical protein